ncbi:DUF2796 domain-containing protein [Marinicella sp. W31]|uniref:ZrgA family zinc uptake protein n=1 Tax=Marinicella sp. W31 TaxID=3023713 RepID=UPI003757F3DA
MKKQKLVLLLLGTGLFMMMLSGKIMASDVHVHGEADMHIVLENTKLHVEFTSPIFNLAGFETDRLSDSQRKQLDSVKSKLIDSDKWLDLKGGDCSLTQSKSGSSYDDSDSVIDHSNSGAHAHHHSAYASFLFMCQQPELLTQLSVSIKNEFPGIEKINIQWIVGNQQGATIGVNPTVMINFKNE